MKPTKAFKKNTTGIARIKCSDSHFTGEEPVWVSEDISYLKTKEKFQNFCTKAFNFYNYYFERADYLYVIYEFMMNHPKFTEKEAKTLVAHYPDDMGANVLGGLARMSTMGAPSTVDAVFGIEDILQRIRHETRQRPTEVKKAGPTPIELARRAKERIAREKVEGLIGDFECIFDSWVESPRKKPAKWDLESALNAAAVDSRHLLPLKAYFVRLRLDLLKVLNKRDPQLMEGYSYLTKRSLQMFLDELENLVTTLDNWKKPVKPRKPRVKKARAADKQIKQLKFAIDNDEFNLTSINPLVVPGSQHLYVFNTRYRTLSVYHALSADGFSVKGTTIQNFDQKASYTITLRKPTEVLNQITRKTPKQIDKLLGDLTTQKKTATGRINNHCILYRVIATRKPI